MEIETNSSSRPKESVYALLQLPHSISVSFSIAETHHIGR